MSKDSISLNMLTLASDPLRISIWFEIQRKAGITAKEIIQKLKLEGTNIYYHLNKLERSRLIVSESKPVPKSNLLEKYYSINMAFFAPEEWKARFDIGKSKKHLKDIILYNLYFNMFLINKQIIDVQEQTNEQIQKTIDLDQYGNTVSKFVFLQKDDLPKVRAKIDEFFEFLDQIKRDTGKDPKTDISDATDTILINLLPL